MSETRWKRNDIGVFDAPGVYTTGDAAGVGDPGGMNAASGSGGATVTADVAPTTRPKLTTLASFTGADGENPNGGLIADAAGDLFGTTYAGGADNSGTVFEIAKTRHGYAGTPTVLVSFTGPDGAQPAGSLIADAAGDLFGTTSTGGTNGDGTVFEIARTRHGYASAPTTLVNFTGADHKGPFGSLITDAAGDLFGMTDFGGADDDGTVFEIAKTRHGYASAPTTLVSFTGADGANPAGSLMADAAGDLFGMTQGGGTDDKGTVFEIAKTRHGYAGAPTTLASFTGADGATPFGSLIADAAGDLFGTTSGIGAGGDGTVFEIAKTRHGYASTPTTLVTFGGADGLQPLGSLIADAAGNLFGTTSAGGPHDGGTVFEIARTRHGYAGAPTTLVSFEGGHPSGSLIADAAGDLFGTTFEGGTSEDGTAFEITHSGFVPPAAPATPAAADTAHSSSPPVAFAQAMASHAPERFASSHAALPAARPASSPLLALPQIA